MKNKMIKTLVAVTLITSTFLSSVVLANPSSGRIHFTGNIVHMPCNINTSSTSQVISLRTANGQMQRISIPLANCQEVTSNKERFSVTLKSFSETIKLYDSNRKAIKLGQSNDESSFNELHKQSLQLFAQTSLTDMKSDNLSSSTLLLSYF
ncbi:fimbrial protein [Vibrio sagamiensis]|nr:type 1 fimbrial protein [Vibrio sagamiensis]